MIFSHGRGEESRMYLKLLLRTDREIHLNLALQCPGPKYFSTSHSAQAAETPLEKSPAWTSCSFVPSTKRLCCLTSVDSFCFFFFFFLLLNYENTAVLSWMDDSLAQLLLKIQINSLSLLFMNHKQKRKAALKGHFVNMSPGKCPTPDSGRHNKINKYFLKKILIFCFPVGFIIQQPDLQPPCNSTDKSNGCSLKDLEFRIVELRLEKTSVHH